MTDAAPSSTGGSAGGAYLAWDVHWREAPDDNRWTRPEPQVVDILPLLRDRGVRRVLDLGSGLGRHSLLLAAEGYEVVGVDASPAGLQRSRGWTRPGTKATFVLADMRDLPFDDETFDYVLDE